MKSWIGIILLLLAAFGLLGMGKLDPSEKPGEIPVPDKEISVTLTDIEGLTIHLSQFSINGQTTVTGKLGAGRVTLSMNQIRWIGLTPDPDKGILARVELTDHSKMNLLLEKGAMVFGKLKSGTYQVALDQLKKIEVLGVMEKKKEKDRKF